MDRYRSRGTYGRFADRIFVCTLSIMKSKRRIKGRRTRGAQYKQIIHAHCGPHHSASTVQFAFADNPRREAKGSDGTYGSYGTCIRSTTFSSFSIYTEGIL